MAYEIDIPSFRERLRHVINELGVTDQEFAAVGNVSKSTLSGYFSSERQPKAESLALWVAHYGIDANWLLLGEGEMKRGSVELSEFERTDPIAQRMRYAVRLMKEHGGSPEEIRTAITLALKGPEA